MDVEQRSARSTRDALQKHDDAVMETNNSCIVSKRSVEKLYRSNEPEFLRYFVKKFQRRSPLINRGYWLRMKAVEHVVLNFLNSASRPKLIVNLGCGYDLLPFRFLKLYPKLCHRATFVDVDYPKIIKKKREIIVNTDPLCEALEDLDTLNPQDPVLIRARGYLALGCDLKQIDRLTKALEDLTKNCSVLFLAEVVITYMEPEDADHVIRWASQYHDARFCLLEQHLPSGPEHPFAQTMLGHFKKLQSPLLVLGRYPQIHDQHSRFINNGWSAVDVTDLWSLWGHESFLKPSERRALDLAEPFDEWEELALFAGHYFILVAANVLKNSGHEALFPVPATIDSSASLDQYDAKLICKYYPNYQHRRRFGASMIIEQEEKLPDIIGYHGGIGQKSRLATCDIYTDLNFSDQFKGPPTEALMNHTITYHRNSKYLFVGGRSSPDKARESCWLQDNGSWQEVDSLLPGRYRHCAVQARMQPVSSSRNRINGVLVFGGKTSNGDVLGDWVFWHEEKGWQTIEAVQPMPEPRFGASMWSASKSHRLYGYLTGGMRGDGTVIQDLWKWEVVFKEGLKIVCRDLSKHLDHAKVRSIFGRFGAALVRSEWGMLLLGGITNGVPLQHQDEAVVFEDKSEDKGTVTFSRLHFDVLGPRPLLVGFGAASVHDHGVVLLGGGATCFSFGTYWNVGCYTLTSQDEACNAWHIDEPSTETSKVDTGKDDSLTGVGSPNGSVADDEVPELEELLGSPTTTQPWKRVQIPRVSIASESDFGQVVSRARPVVLEHLPLGTCTTTWSPSYLKTKIGPGRAVVVHSSPSKHMNFQVKNFAYVTMPFGEFIDKVEGGEKLYLRAVSRNKPGKQATNLEEDYPEIASDFQIPPALELVKVQMHSSPLRISGSVSMWLHYDVMANVYCQIRGKKRLILYPPSDVRYLSFAPGASSSEINVFTTDASTHPSLASTHPHEVVLEPGDVLFIPAFWMHAAAPADGISIAVNVFFRNLDKGYATGRDVYGNRDLEAYEKGRQDISKILKSFDNLPQDVREFYLARLSGEFQRCVQDVTGAT